MQNSHETNNFSENGNGYNGNHNYSPFEENEQNALKEILISKNLYPENKDGLNSHTEVPTEHTSEVSHDTHIEHEHVSHEQGHGEVAEEKISIMKFLKPLIFLLIIIILFILSIAIVKFVPKAISSTTNYLSTIIGGNKINFTEHPKEISNGEKLNFKWSNPSAEEGSYFWSFECTPGITVFYDAVEGEKKPVVCNTSFPLPNQKEGGYSFYVQSNSPSKLTLPMTITFFDVNQKKLISSDKVKISVTQKKEEATESVPATENYNPNYETPTTTAKLVTNTVTSNPQTTTASGSYGTQSTYYGNPDLSISLFQASAVSTNGSLKDISNANYGDRIVVRVRVANIGTSPSGAWSISSVLPTSSISDRNFNTNAQPSLRPGDLYEMNISFSNFNGSLGSIALTLISQNDINFVNNTLNIPVPNTNSYDDSYINSYSYSSGRADLKVRILAVGTLNSYNNFRETDNLDDNDTIGVRFEVTNEGGEDANNFDIEVRLPNDDNDDYEIKNVDLRRGESRIFLVGIDEPKRGDQKITVEVDSNKDIREKSESNNTDSERVEIDN